MESSIPTNESHSDDAVESSVGNNRDACSEGNVTDSVMTDGIFSCSTSGGDCSAAEKCTESLDPYSYVQRGDYTSEVFKLELMNLPKRFGIAVSKFGIFLTSALFYRSI